MTRNLMPTRRVKRSRPAGSEENLTRLVQTHVTPTIADELERRAVAANLKLSTYVRVVLLRHIDGKA